MGTIERTKNDDVGYIENFFDQNMIDWCLWYFSQFDNQRFNGRKYIQETHWNLPFNQWFGDYCKKQVKKVYPEALIHSIYIGNDVKTGGIHTDGWLYEGEKELFYKTILIPLKFNVPSSTIIFNERESKGRTLNQITGLGNDGIETMEQFQELDKHKIFPKEIHDKYLKHLDYSGLHGLSVHGIMEWHPGRALTWDRERWHGPVCFEGNNIERYHVTIMTHKK